MSNVNVNYVLITNYLLTPCGAVGPAAFSSPLKTSQNKTSNLRDTMTRKVHILRPKVKKLAQLWSTVEAPHTGEPWATYVKGSFSLNFITHLPFRLTET